MQPSKMPEQVDLVLIQSAEDQIRTWRDIQVRQGNAYEILMDFARFCKVIHKGNLERRINVYLVDGRQPIRRIPPPSKNRRRATRGVIVVRRQPLLHEGSCMLWP